MTTTLSRATRRRKSTRSTKKADGTAVSDDSDVSVIEIPSDGEEAARGCAMDKDKESPRRGRGRPRKSVDTSDGGKRRRGRPPKGAAPDTEEESPTKKSRTESDDDTPTMKKEEAKCPHCPKSFPSQNSLTTHIQHHNLENSLRNKAGAVRQSVIPEYRHRCDDCQESFKNSILLKRHQCKKKAPPKL
ncbi:hypothetical protein NQ318_014740 [Aromia moschata]|uniref:C2H2-type domain-containing protein n=1 Tax=Aromia moschata TaxID=1265417 RepID=A0AAV8ZC66_9CUCU|nr:hypothetical protein NQ318_014740 [Aromia moschata]